MRCERCSGRAFKNWDGDWICLLCGRPAYLAPPPASAFGFVRLMGPAPGPRKRGGRKCTVTDDDVAVIREETAGLRWGGKEANYRRLAERFGISAIYVKQIALGHKRA